MYEYHVTYGAFKKIIKSGSNIAKDIHEPIKKAFLLDSTSSLYLQYFHARHNDWVDCEETDEMTNDTKLNVWQNVQQLDLQELDSSTLSAPPPSNMGLRCSTPTENSTSWTTLKEYSQDEQPSEQMNLEDFPYVYKLPQFPMWLQTMLDTRSPLCKEAKCRRGVIDALFDDLLRYGYYPTSQMFQETLVEKHPILKDKQFVNAQPHDSWVLRLRDKFKKHRSRNAELCNTDELERMKAKYGKKRDRTPSNTDNGLDDSLRSVKRMKVQQSSKYEEDDFSVNIHIKVLQEECKKHHQNDDIIRDKMDRTFLHRAKYITTHSVTETLTCFPPLQQTNELLNEAKRLRISEDVLREFLVVKKNSLSQLAQKRKSKYRGLSQLLTAQAECTCTEDSELAFSILVLPCLLQEKFPSLYLEEGVEISVFQPVIVHRKSSNVLNDSAYEIFLDKQFITKTEDLITAVTLYYTLFWLFDVGYSKSQHKFLTFLDTYVFKIFSVAPVPRSVKSLFNTI